MWYILTAVLSDNCTFEACVSAKSSTAPVACGYRREVLGVSIVSIESTVCLYVMNAQGAQKKTVLDIIIK